MTTPTPVETAARLGYEEWAKSTEGRTAASWDQLSAPERDRVLQATQAAIEAYERAAWSSDFSFIPRGEPLLLYAKYGGQRLRRITKVENPRQALTHWRPLPAGPV